MYRRIQQGILWSIVFPKRHPALWLTLCYLTLSVLWILLSDTLAVALAGANELLFQEIQAVKGILFVLLSGFLFFVFSQKMYTGLAFFSRQQEKVEENFQALNEALREGVFDYNVARDSARVNTKASFFFPDCGTRVDQFWNRFLQRIHPADVEKQLAEYAAVTEEGRKSWQTEFRMLGADNQYYNVICNVYLIRRRNETTASRFIGAIQDISDLRKMQLENYEQRLEHKRTLARSIIQAQEKERNRWAEELHDNVCQILSVANLYTSEICTKPEHAVAMAPEVKKLLVESLQEIRQLSAHIKTPCFSTESLGNSIESLCANIGRVCPAIFNLDMKKLEEDRLDNEQKLMIYRIVQEQVNNIVKYASATNIEIILETIGTEVKIVVKDDGCGFEPSKVKTGIGLRNLQSRLQVYSGKLTVQSSPGMGCCVIAIFNIQN